MVEMRVGVYGKEGRIKGEMRSKGIETGSVTGCRMTLVKELRSTCRIEYDAII